MTSSQVSTTGKMSRELYELVLAANGASLDASGPGKTLPDVLTAATQGTNQAYREDNRPTADLHLPTLNEHTLGQVFQMLMLATVTEGRLTGINPYGQPGVEAYKKNMNAILAALPD